MKDNQPDNTWPAQPDRHPARPRPRPEKDLDPETRQKLQASKQASRQRIIEAAERLNNYLPVYGDYAYELADLESTRGKEERIINAGWDVLPADRDNLAPYVEQFVRLHYMLRLQEDQRTAHGLLARREKPAPCLYCRITGSIDRPAAGVSAQAHHAVAVGDDDRADAAGAWFQPNSHAKIDDWNYRCGYVALCSECLNRPALELRQRCPYCGNQTPERIIIEGVADRLETIMQTGSISVSKMDVTEVKGEQRDLPLEECLILRKAVRDLSLPRANEYQVAAEQASLKPMLLHTGLN